MPSAFSEKKEPVYASKRSPLTSSSCNNSRILLYIPTKKAKRIKKLSTYLDVMPTLNKLARLMDTKGGPWAWALGAASGRTDTGVSSVTARSRACSALATEYDTARIRASLL